MLKKNKDEQSKKYSSVYKVIILLSDTMVQPSP